MNDEITLNIIKKKLTTHFHHEFPDAFAITEKTGIQTYPKRKFWESAEKAGRLGRCQKDKNTGVYWFPLFVEGEIIAICGLSGHKKCPLEQIAILKNLLSQIVYDEYLGKLAEIVEDQDNIFIYNLLTKNIYKDPEIAILEADIMGLNLRRKQAVILCKIPGLFKKIGCHFEHEKKMRVINYISSECKKISKSISESFDNSGQDILAWIDTDTLACLVAGNDNINTTNSINYFKKKANNLYDEIVRKTKIKPTIGIGQYYPDTTGLRKSYKIALASLNIGWKIWGPKGIYHVTDIGMYISFSDDIPFNHKCEIAFQIMGKVFEDPCLVKTLNTYFEHNMNLSEAAKKLHIHRNTLIYRLTKINRLIHRNPQNFNDAVRIRLGMLLFEPQMK